MIYLLVFTLALVPALVIPAQLSPGEGECSPVAPLTYAAHTHDRPGRRHQRRMQLVFNVGPAEQLTRSWMGCWSLVTAIRLTLT